MSHALLTSRTCSQIEGWLSQSLSPVLLWSGGKDSMVLLHLLTQIMRTRIPCVLYREPWWPEKYAFHDALAVEWGLTVHSPWPMASMAYRDDATDKLVLLARYPLRGQGQTMDVPKDVIRFPDDDSNDNDTDHAIGDEGTMVPGEIPGRLPQGGAHETDPLVSPVAADSRHWPAPPPGYACGLDILSRPRANSEFPWDLALIGHKDCDTDPVLGRIPLWAPIVPHAGGTSLGYPLKDWTDADIWDYIEHHGVPMDEGRYDVEHRTNWPSRRLNADWMHACTRCVEVGFPERVDCPKLNREVRGASHTVLWVDSLERYNFIAADRVAATPPDAPP